VIEFNFTLFKPTDDKNLVNASTGATFYPWVWLWNPPGCHPAKMQGQGRAELRNEAEGTDDAQAGPN
jgi:hypothetical protein